jgi:hypothetical protein
MGEAAVTGAAAALLAVCGPTTCSHTRSPTAIRSRYRGVPHHCSRVAVTAASRS